MRTICNLKEAEALVEKYNSIILEELRKAYVETQFFNNSNNKFTRKILNKLTGFGSSRTCSLCKKVSKYENMVSCTGCIYYNQKQGANSCMTNSYLLLDNFVYGNKLIEPQLESVLALIKHRAKVIQRLIDKVKNNPDKYQII